MKIIYKAHQITASSWKVVIRTIFLYSYWTQHLTQFLFGTLLLIPELNNLDFKEITFVLILAKFGGKRGISGFRGGDYEDSCLLGCCAVLSGRKWPTFQRCLRSPSSEPWNVGHFVPDYVAQHPNRQPSLITKYHHSLFVNLTPVTFMASPASGTPITCVIPILVCAYVWQETVGLCNTLRHPLPQQSSYVVRPPSWPHENITGHIPIVFCSAY
jgi:hypothetical protein